MGSETTPTATPRRRARRGPSRAVAWVLAGAVLAGGLGATRYAVRSEHRASAVEDSDRLTRLARRQAEAVAGAVREDVAVLQAAAAFQAVNGRNYGGFNAFTGALPLDDHPGLSWVSFIVPVAPAQVPTLEDERRADGQPDFTVRRGPLDERHHVVLFAGPNPGPPVGTDVGMIGMLPYALDRAADRGSVEITDAFIRFQDRALPSVEQIPAVAIYVPVYAPGAPTSTVQQRRDALLGWTSSSIQFQALLGELDLPVEPEIRISISDADTPTDELAAHPAAAAPGDAERVVVELDVLNEDWQLEAVMLPTFERADSRALPIAVAGGLASLAVAALVLNLALQRRRLSLRVRAALAAAAATERRFRAVFDNAPVGVAVIDHDGNVVDINDAMAEMIGLDEGHPLRLADCLLPEDVDDWMLDLERFRSGELQHLVVQRRLRRSDGTTFWARTTSAPLRGEQAIVALVQDVTTERAAAEAAEELRSRRARFEALVRHSTDLITVIGPDRRILYASPAIAALVGVNPEEALGSDAVDHVHPADRIPVAESMALAMLSPGVHGPVRYRLVSIDGSVRWVEATMTNLLDDPDVGGVVANCRDVTAQEEAAESLRQRAFHDPLTGLATRDVLLDRLAIALISAHGSAGTVALLFVDLDRFKQVNDRYGHAAGDALLVEVSKAIVDAVRPGDMVARHGGDEFVVLLEAVKGVREARAVAERVRAALRRPFLVGAGVVVEPGASVGLAVADGSASAEAMLRDADAALYRAKANGRDRVEVFDDDLRRRAVRRQETEEALRVALEEDTLAVRFEPVADLAGGGIVGAEARIRLALPSGEVVPYAELLPVAQEAGLASELASHALDAACGAVAAWSLSTDGPRWVGLDVSAGEVTHPTFIERLAGVLAATGVEAGALRLELPVDVVSQGTSLTRRAIAAAQALGVHVVLDGVGAELRSLAALGSLAVDGLKLDLAALPDAVADPVAAAVASSVGEVAAAAGLPVVVVGADADDQLAVVRRLGFRYVQGAAVAPMADVVDLVTI
jgi:diguanylate cyclase (GGDEF)-like protein/PAS domain S-box-containing protein